MVRGDDGEIIVDWDDSGALESYARSITRKGALTLVPINA